MTQFMIHHQTT